MLKFIAIMSGGAIGALARYLVSNGIYSWLGRDFPYGTLFVNFFGSFLMGFLSLFFLNYSNISSNLQLMVLVGLLGAFTTFSTFSLDTLNLINEGKIELAFLNITLSVGICLLAVFLGLLLARYF